ncbi:rhomboid family intramembrane serine protease [Pontibacter sp. G13]|uniref:rhomboid family intramembrane serine protease n=1 Tax=Pontibacter sp. G13 TaxID=3074898 RepID=UPI00288AE420|nr:rhomboid family intramembrane serine protease [Pontibacter sp. G13]WNJ19949.1 rhomboid family intramembrane serine protease [Pontibacter sp. G13]
MKLQYNAPVVLTFTLICSAVLLLDPITGDNLIKDFFTVYPEFNLAKPAWYLRLFTHVIGHGNWEHLVGNFTFILLLGPILEEKYGSRDLLLMIVVTSFVTGILQVLVFDQALLGASGIVFMMILLSSITNFQGGIPITFVLVVILFLGKEVVNSFGTDNVSQFAHIIGGILGGIFGFVLEDQKLKGRKKKDSKPLTSA